MVAANIELLRKIGKVTNFEKGLYSLWKTMSATICTSQ